MLHRATRALILLLAVAIRGYPKHGGARQREVLRQVGVDLCGTYVWSVFVRRNRARRKEDAAKQALLAAAEAESRTAANKNCPRAEEGRQGSAADPSGSGAAAGASAASQGSGDGGRGGANEVEEEGQEEAEEEVRKWCARRLVMSLCSATFGSVAPPPQWRA